MKVLDLNEQLENNEISIIYGFGSNNIIIISEKKLKLYEKNDFIKFGIQTIKIIKELKNFSIPSIDSTININKNIYTYEVEE